MRRRATTGEMAPTAPQRFPVLLLLLLLVAGCGEGDRGGRPALTTLHASDGRAHAWFGDIWTTRNWAIVCGLEDAGKHNLAAELSWATIKAFSGNYHEFLVPSTGVGHGNSRYGFSASQYIQLVVEHLFGMITDLRGLS